MKYRTRRACLFVVKVESIYIKLALDARKKEKKRLCDYVSEEG